MTTPQEVADFLESNKIGCLAVEIGDTNLHAAAVHYSFSLEPLVIYIQTNLSSRKCLKLAQDQRANASFVVGFSEDEWLTLQLDGVIELLETPAQISEFAAHHYQRFPKNAQHRDDPEVAKLKFTPNWGRYTNFNTQPKTTINL